MSKVNRMFTSACESVSLIGLSLRNYVIVDVVQLKGTKTGFAIFFFGETQVSNVLIECRGQTFEV